MGRLEAQIRDHLRDSGIKCQSVYRLPDADENRVVLAFNSKDNQRLSTRKIERTLNNLGILYRRIGMEGDAQKAYREAIEIYERYSTISLSEYEKDLKRTYFNLDILLKQESEDEIWSDEEEDL